MKWEYRKVIHGDQVSAQYLEELLNAGWEPFAVTLEEVHSIYYDTVFETDAIHLKRQA